MRGYRRFVIILLGVLAAALLYNLVVWQLYTHSLLGRGENGVIPNDLARMGYLSGYTHPRRNFDDLPRRHLELADYRGGAVDVVTVGDSFSQGSSNGPNRFYQDYLATLSDVSVLNVGLYPGSRSQIETAILLVNSGFLDQMRPRFLLLEIVERNCYKFTGPHDWGKTEDPSRLRRNYADRAAATAAAVEEGRGAPPVGFFNTGNFKWLLYNILYRFAPDAFVSKTCMVELDRPLFSGERGESLLFLRKDIEKVQKAEPSTLRAFNDNLNRLAELLRARGIELVFMPAPDKYTLYSPYIVDNPYPPSRFFELLRPLPKAYRFIDTEAILSAEIARGEKDVYYLDDTHWSWKASRAIFAAERFR
jgi:hypothetical protein